MKKDRRTKAQLLEEINRLQSENYQLKVRNEETIKRYETDDMCRKNTHREYKLSEELSEAKEYSNVFKDSLKFILTKAR